MPPMMQCNVTRSVVNASDANVTLSIIANPQCANKRKQCTAKKKPNNHDSWDVTILGYTITKGRSFFCWNFNGKSLSTVIEPMNSELYNCTQHQMPTMSPTTMLHPKKEKPMTLAMRIPDCHRTNEHQCHSRPVKHTVGNHHSISSARSLSQEDASIAA